MKSKIALNTRLASLDFEPFSGGFFSIFPSFYFSSDIFPFITEPSMQRQRYNSEHWVGTLYMVIRVFSQEDTFFHSKPRHLARSFDFIFHFSFKWRGGM